MNPRRFAQQQHSQKPGEERSDEDSSTDPGEERSDEQDEGKQSDLTKGHYRYENACEAER